MSSFHLFGSVSGPQSFIAVVSVMILAGMVHIYVDKLPEKVGTRCVLGLLMVVAALHQMLFDAVAEDAFITFRYVENLVNGNGLVFNLGEDVEGYSNFLWLMMVAGVHWLTGAEVPVVGRLLGAVLSLGTLGWAYLLAARVYLAQRSSTIVVVAFMATYSIFAAWALAGLENGLHGLLLVAALHCAFQGRWRCLSVVWVLLALCRIDGVVWIVPFGLWALIAGRGCSITRRMWRLFYPFACLYGAYTAWRVDNFGYWLPNSVAAKQGADPIARAMAGVEYLGQQLIPSAAWLFAALLVMFIIVETRNNTKELDALDTRHDPDDVERRVRTWLLGALLVTQLVYVAAIGGDWAPAGRFLSVLTPVVGLLLGSLWGQMSENSAWSQARRSGRTLLVLICLGSLSISYTFPGLYRTARFWNTLLEDAATMGTWLNEHVPADTLVVSSGAGVMPYYSKLPTVDVYGVTNEHVARHGKRTASLKAGHLAADRDYLLSLSPAIIFLDPFVFSKTLPGWSSFESDSSYAPILFHFDDEKGGRYLRLHIERSMVQKLTGLLTRPRHVSVVVPKAEE